MHKALATAVFQEYIDFSLSKHSGNRDYFFHRYKTLYTQSGMNRDFYEQAFDFIDVKLDEIVAYVEEQLQE